MVWRYIKYTKRMGAEGQLSCLFSVELLKILLLTRRKVTNNALDVFLSCGYTYMHVFKRWFYSLRSSFMKSESNI